MNQWDPECFYITHLLTIGFQQGSRKINTSAPYLGVGGTWRERIDQGHLGSGIEQKTIGSAMVHGDFDEHFEVIHEMIGHTGHFTGHCFSAAAVVIVVVARTMHPNPFRLNISRTPQPSRLRRLARSPLIAKKEFRAWSGSKQGSPERRIGIIMGTHADARGRVPLLFATCVPWEVRCQ